MGVFDEVSVAFNRGTNAVERATRSRRLKSELDELNKQRQYLAAQLGASLYEATRGSNEFTDGREELYSGIEKCDIERSRIAQQISQVKSEIEAEENARKLYTCSSCGSVIRGGDMFCTGCGTSVDATRTIQANSTGIESKTICPSCGSGVNPGNSFCIFCGSAVPAQEAPAEEVSFQAENAADAPETEAEPVVAALGPCCPACGVEVGDGQAFCVMCGTSLQHHLCR